MRRVIKILLILTLVFSVLNIFAGAEPTNLEENEPSPKIERQMPQNMGERPFTQGENRTMPERVPGENGNMPKREFGENGGVPNRVPTENNNNTQNTTPEANENSENRMQFGNMEFTEEMRERFQNGEFGQMPPDFGGRFQGGPWGDMQQQTTKEEEQPKPFLVKYFDQIQLQASR